MTPAMTEAVLYTQLTHLFRVLDPNLAVSRCKDDTEKHDAQKCALLRDTHAMQAFMVPLH